MKQFLILAFALIASPAFADYSGPTSSRAEAFTAISTCVSHDGKTYYYVEVGNYGSSFLRVVDWSRGRPVPVATLRIGYENGRRFAGDAWYGPYVVTETAILHAQGNFPIAHCH